MKIPLNIGIEWEFFLTKDNVVFNASKEMERILGFSIDQNKIGAGSILFNDNLSLRTDGTVCEAHYYLPYWAPYSSQDSVHIFRELNEFALLKNFQRCFCPYLASGQAGLQHNTPTIFDSPGVVHASGKMMRNAYRKSCWYPDKKEDEENGKKVSFRTAGVHFHLGIRHNQGTGDKNKEGLILALEQKIFNTSDYSHTDELVRRFDEIYKHYFHYMYKNPVAFPEVSAREEKYQHFGDYRLKFNTIEGHPTLEYRQLPSSVDANQLKEFINMCAVEFGRYVNSIL